MIYKNCWKPEFPNDDFCTAQYRKEFFALEKEFDLDCCDTENIRQIAIALHKKLHMTRDDSIAKAFKLFAEATHKLSNKQVRAIANYYRRQYFHYPEYEAVNVYYDEIYPLEEKK